MSMPPCITLKARNYTCILCLPFPENFSLEPACLSVLRQADATLNSNAGGVGCEGSS